jgi:hypothetical protein
MYVQGGAKEIAIYSKKKECEHISTSASTSRDIGEGRQLGWGFEGFDGFIANHWYVR